ncbi:hypothetical protein M595_5084 [Lyngbya aestuarii BL J]|uniref:Uncharacterized protein n=1 Tax=Lyngbya aestuarii BL J TaxID=1348334 RepID=U7QEX6_9CYAN|nr:hypothetical protein M595_5084 [Lyngbya aestuarii BL J]
MHQICQYRGRDTHLVVRVEGWIGPSPGYPKRNRSQFN